MSILEVITAPDPRLKQLSQPVDQVDETVRQQMLDMLETMYDAPGIGLAAPQVGILNRVLVMDLGRTEEEREPFLIANPEIIWESDELSTFSEGCLSVPEHYAEVERPAAVRFKFLDIDNQQQEMEIDGLLSTCLQHEIDHLDGTLFIDHISSLKKNMIIRKLKKAKKDTVIL